MHAWRLLQLCVHYLARVASKGKQGLRHVARCDLDLFAFLVFMQLTHTLSGSKLDLQID